MIDKTCFSWVQLIKKSDLPSNAKLLAFYLSTFMNLEHDVAWPSMKRICGETGLSTPTARKWLDYLNDEGWLIKHKNTHKVVTSGGPQLQNEYIIDIPDHILRGVNDLPPSPKGGQTVEQRGVSSFPKGGKLLTPNNNRITILNNNKQKTPKPPKNDFELPPGVNPQAWMEFLEHRTQIRKPLSDLAKTKSANILLKLTFENQQSCVDYSIAGRYQGLFPEKFTTDRGNGNGTHQKNNSKGFERGDAIGDEWLAENQAKRERQIN